MVRFMSRRRQQGISTRRRRVALIIESSRAYGRGLFFGVAKFVREHHEWSVQSEEWKWTDPFPEWLINWQGDGIQAIPLIGVMACNDIRGQQVLNLCRRLDLAVPEEV